MGKFLGLLAAVLSIMFFNSCSDVVLFQKSEIKRTNHKFENVYGNFLAGQVAVLRNDYANSSKYLEKAYIKSADKKEKLGEQLYTIFAAEGNIAKSAEYAKKVRDADKNNAMIYSIITVNDIVNNNYDYVTEKNPSGSYLLFLQPVIIAWGYAGKGEKEKAFAQLKEFGKLDGMNDYYLYNKAMLHEYFDQIPEAKETYEQLIKNAKNNLSFYDYCAIIEFYMRNSMKKEAEKLAKLSVFEGGAKEAKEEYTKRILKSDSTAQYHKVSPQTAISDVMLHMSAWMTRLRYSPELSYIYMQLASYANPQNIFLKFAIGLHLEYMELYDQALAYYEEIKENDYFYYMAQMKTADIYVQRKEYVKAEDTLKKLLRKYPDKENLQLRIGDILRLQQKYQEAFKYYLSLIDEHKDTYQNNWGIYYAIGSVLDASGQWNKAEEYLKKALDLSNGNYIVQNHIGYAWVDRNLNINEAFENIAKAYITHQYEAHIVDSMGWAFFKIGDSKRAVKYLEKAVSLQPGNALMNEHLGDAYWIDGRKNEAGFQWNHAMVLEEDAEEVDKEKLKQKIEDGLTDYHPIENYNHKKINIIITDYDL